MKKFCCQGAILYMVRRVPCAGHGCGGGEAIRLILTVVSAAMPMMQVPRRISRWPRFCVSSLIPVAGTQMVLQTNHAMCASELTCPCSLRSLVVIVTRRQDVPPGLCVQGGCGCDFAMA